MPSASWHIHLKGDYSVSLAFALRQHVSKTSLKSFFIVSLVFQRKDSPGEGDRRIKWIRLFISNNKFRILMGVIRAPGRWVGMILDPALQPDSMPIPVLPARDNLMSGAAHWCHIPRTTQAQSLPSDVENLVSLKHKGCPQNFLCHAIANKMSRAK